MAGSVDKQETNFTGKPDPKPFNNSNSVIMLATQPQGFSYSVNRPTKPLLVNGGVGIRYYAHETACSGSLFLEENILLVLLEGKLEVRYGKTNFLVTKNMMIFLKKEIVIDYSITVEPDEKVRYIVFSLKPEIIKEFIKLAALPLNQKDVIQIIVKEVGRWLLKYVESLEYYLDDPETVNGSIVRIKLLELLFNLNFEYQQILEQVLDLREHFRPNITFVVQENILSSLSLQQLAVLSGRSLSSFRRDFLAIYNVPPSLWIQQKKLQKAQELLLTTNMTVKDICYTTGLTTLHTFQEFLKISPDIAHQGFGQLLLLRSCLMILPRGIDHNLSIA